MKKIEREEMEYLITYNKKETLWSRIQDVQSSDMLSIDMISEAIKSAHTDLKKWYPGTAYIESLSSELRRRLIIASISTMSVKDHMEAIAELIDWTARPWATGLKLGYMTKDIVPTSDRIADPFMSVPRPAPKMRTKTDEELTRDLISKLRSDDLTFRGSANIRELCKTAGIPLDVLE